MDLLSKFETVTVKTDQRISPADKAFCEKQQAAYEAAIEAFQELAFFWADIRKTQQELLGTPNYNYLSSHSGPEISEQKINSHIEYLHRELICTLVRHFNSTYSVSVSAEDVCNNLLPHEPDRWSSGNKELYAEYHEKLRNTHIQYGDVVDQVILLLDGRSFAEQAFYELAEKCHKAAWNTYKKVPEYERRKNVLRFLGYFCHVQSWGRQDEWELNDGMKNILRGAAHFETDAYDLYPLGFSDLLGYSRTCDNEQEFPTCEKVKGLKMFKNGRVDLKFATEAYAEEFVTKYLGLIC